MTSKLQLITIPLIEKGLAVEIYQQLKEDEIDLSEVGKNNSIVNYQSEPCGTWYKKTSRGKRSYRL